MPLKQIFNSKKFIYNVSPKMGFVAIALAFISNWASKLVFFLAYMAMEIYEVYCYEKVLQEETAYYDADTENALNDLPEEAPLKYCPQCNNKKVLICSELDITAENPNSQFHIECGNCGHQTNSHEDLLTALEEWNNYQEGNHDE